MLLHGLGLAVAAVVGVGVEGRREPDDTFVLSLRTGADGAESELEGASEEGQADDAPLPAFLALAVLPELTAEPAASGDELAPEPVPEPEPVSDEAALSASESETETAEPDPAPLLASETASASAVAGASDAGASADAAIRSRPRAAPRHYFVAEAGDRAGAPVPVGPRPGQPRSAARGSGVPAALPRGGSSAGSGGDGGEVTGLVTPRPPYPRLSVRAGEEGSVLCRLHVNAKGAVTQVDVVESSGHERLDESARTTLLAWRFEPRVRDGVSVAATVLHRVTFRLEG